VGDATKVGVDFDAWLGRLDELCWGRLGCGIRDVEEQPLRAMFEDGSAPEEAMDEVVENLGMD
jgi:hypothetical protein